MHRHKDPKMAKSVNQSGVSHLSLLGHKDSVGCVEWSNSLSLLASASDDGSVRLWDTRTGGKCVKAISAFDKNPVQLVAWAPPKSPISSSLWAACGRDLCCFDIRGNNDMVVREALLKFADVCEEGDNDDEISFIHLHPKNGEQIAVADDSGQVHLLNLKRLSSSSSNCDITNNQYSLERGDKLSSHRNIVTGALFRPTTIRDILSGSLDGTLMGWDLSKPNKPIWTENMDLEEVSSNSTQSLNPPLVHGIAVHGSGRYFAAGLGDGSISVHSFTKPPQFQHRLRRLSTGHTSSVAQVHFAGFDEDFLISAGNDKRISFWRLGSLFEGDKTINKSKSKSKKHALNQTQKQAEEVVEEDEILPHGRLAHTEKINWLSSETGSCSVHVADVSPVITVFDVSRI